MNKRVFGFFIALFVMAGAAFYASPAAAFDGINITVRDNVTGQGWTHGGDVYVINGNGDIVASGSLDGSGNLTLSYGTDDLSVCGVSCSAATGMMTISIDYTCTQSGNTCDPSNGTPATSTATTYTEISALPFPFSANITTGTGPSAVTLSGFGSSSNSDSGLALLVATAVLFAGASYVVLRRRQVLVD